jgi:hypothetical protein
MSDYSLPVNGLYTRPLGEAPLAHTPYPLATLIHLSASGLYKSGFGVEELPYPATYRARSLLPAWIAESIESKRLSV